MGRRLGQGTEEGGQNHDLTRVLSHSAQRQKTILWPEWHAAVRRLQQVVMKVEADNERRWVTSGAAGRASAEAVKDNTAPMLFDEPVATATAAVVADSACFAGWAECLGREEAADRSAFGLREARLAEERTAALSAVVAVVEAAGNALNFLPFS